MQTLSEKSNNRISAVIPRLATNYEGGDPVFLEKVAPIVDLIEVVPDSIAESKNGRRTLNQATLAELRNICKDTPVIAHGVGLSIGSCEGFSNHYLRLLDELVENVDVVWHSEHLGYTNVEGINLGTMLPLPMTDEALDMVCERVIEIRQRYGLPFLLENVAHVLPVYEDGYSAAGFLNAVAQHSGCHILLDAYNLECDVHNHALNLDRFFDELAFDAVWEVHLANGVEHRGLQLDVHSRLIEESTLQVARRILSETGQVRAVTYELLSQAIPVLGQDAIVDELERIRCQVL
jgi:uncharacterized protein (UPF0276 family)